MKGSFDDFLIYDIFEKLSKYLSVQDIVNVLMVNISCYGNYKYNKNYCNKIFVKKIIRSFGFQRVFNKTNSIKHLFRMFYYFKNHKCYTADFLVYMIDNSIKDIDLFRFYASQCCFINVINDTNNEDARIFNYSDLYISDWYVPNRLINDTFISLNDMKYILVNSDIDQLGVLFDLFNIPISLLSYTISNSTGDNYLLKCIKYMFVKHCFGKFNDDDNSYIYEILVCLIRYKRTNVLKYFIDQKREYIMRGHSIDYQSLINRCIELEDKIHLEILIKEQKYDNDKGLLERSFIIINTHRVIKLCEMAKFDYLRYLVKRHLGKSINTMIYIDSICMGLEMLILYNNFKIKNIQLLSEYINDDNKIYINNYITKCYNNIKLDKSKRVFIY
jgi:hypothetical protein